MFSRRHPNRPGFTLVELLVVIAIIGVIAAIAVPTILMARIKAMNTRAKMEISSIEKAVESYKAKYQDYPPDFSDQQVVLRHINKVFPRISPTERTTFMTRIYASGISSIDPAEALVFWLGGFSDNKQLPFTGNGGPLIDTGSAYVYNSDRNIGPHSFDQGRLTLRTNSSGQMVSNDETQILGLSGADDAFPVYLPQGMAVPFVYFDSRSYMRSYPATSGMPNGDPSATTAPSASTITQIYPPTAVLSSTSIGVARPYRSDLVRTATPSDPITFRWLNEKTYQILCAGLDDNYGEWETGPNSYNKQFPTALNYALDRSDHDNISNFSIKGTFEDSLP